MEDFGGGEILEFNGLLNIDEDINNEVRFATFER